MSDEIKKYLNDIFERIVLINAQTVTSKMLAD